MASVKMVKPMASSDELNVNNSVNLAINKNSLGEMDPLAAKNYLKNILKMITFMEKTMLLKIFHLWIFIFLIYFFGELMI